MSLSVLLSNNGEDSGSIRALMKSKIPNRSISFHTSENSTNNSSNAERLDNKKYDLCIVKNNEIAQAQALIQQGVSVINWEDMRELSAKLDVFLQLHHHLQKYPLNLRDWELTKVLHNSRDCIIYKATDLDENCAAIKRFKFKLDQLSRESIDEYLEVISLQCGTRSTGLLKFIDGGFCNNAFYLVMEYLPFGNLRQFLDSRDCALPLQHALQWFEEIANALAVVHQAGLIHRDLKIDNILLREDGSLALTDYGVSKKFLLNAGLLSEDELHGSPYYVSPELISGEFCSQSSDIYSLGIIFYELLTGTRPYNATNPQDLLMAHIMQPIPVLSGELSVFQACLDQMMAKNPDDRFNDMTELLQSFVLSREAFLESNKVKKTPPHFYDVSTLN